MFEDWKTKRQLKSDLSEKVTRFLAALREAKTAIDRHAAEEAHEIETAPIISELRWMETAKLIKKAKRFGLDLPPRWLVTGRPADWETNKHTNRTYLTDSGATRLSHDISEARFNYWKRWVEIVSPLATILISLFALAVAVLALYLQTSNTTIPPVR